MADESCMQPETAGESVLTPTILVVEDDPGLNQLIRKDLVRAGYRTAGVTSGGAALGAVAKMDDVLLLLDYKLPDMTGEEIVQRLHGAGTAVPFIVMTGCGDEETAVAMMKLGALEYVVKESHFIERLPHLVMRVVDGLVARRRMAQAQRALDESMKALLDSSARWQTTFDAIEHPILLLDARQVITECNRSFMQWFGTDKDHIVGRPCWEIVHGSSGPIEGCPCVGTRRSLKRNLNVLAIGNRTVEVITDPVLDGSGAFAGAVHIMSDITDRKKVEESLRESKALVEAVVENVPLMIFLKEATDLRFVIFNRAGEDLLGYDRTSLLGKNNLDLFPPEQAAHFMAKDREVLDGKAAMLDIPEEPILTAKNGQRVLHTRKVCIRGNDGITKYLLGISEDITERKQAEERQKELEAQLRQSQKMEAIGQLAGGIAHDFNNALGGIMGYAELLKVHLASDAKLKGYAEKIVSLSQRSGELTRQLLAYARKGKMMKAPLDIHTLIRDTVDILSKTIDRRITIGTELYAKPAMTYGDPSQIAHALLNLSINARDAMPEGGVLTFSTSVIALNEDSLKAHGFKVVAGSYLQVAIRDTGTGMDGAVLKRLFEPFFTTKEIGKGTGLGLAGAYGTVKQHDGYIVAESEPGHGSVFTLYLPVLQSGGLREENAEDGRLSTGTGVILVIDDEDPLREAECEMIERLGFRPVGFGDPAEAVAYYRSNYREIDAVVLDLIMPNINGLECFRELKKIRPDVRVLIASGYSDGLQYETVMQEGAGGSIVKPYTASDLSRALAGVLGKADPP